MMTQKEFVVLKTVTITVITWINFDRSAY